jgi:nicotinamidase/pyrazinamidase
MKRWEAPNKSNFITLGEVETWTKEKNGLNKNAWFTIEELKVYLKTNWNIQALWPDHCVDWTSWAEFYKDLDLSLIDVEVKKWFQANTHPYSAFWWCSMDEKTTTIEILKNAWIKLLKIVWLATDYCAMETAVDWKINWFDVEYFYKASAWVSPSSTVEALDKMRNMWIKILS